MPSGAFPDGSKGTVFEKKCTAKSDALARRKFVRDSLSDVLLRPSDAGMKEANQANN